MSKRSARVLLLRVSSSSIFHSDFRFLAGDGCSSEEWRRRRRGRSATRSEITSVWTNTSADLNAFRIGIMRLLAPEVSGSISGVVAMAEERESLEREGERRTGIVEGEFRRVRWWGFIVRWWWWTANGIWSCGARVGDNLGRPWSLGLQTVTVLKRRRKRDGLWFCRDKQRKVWSGKEAEERNKWCICRVIASFVIWRSAEAFVGYFIIFSTFLFFFNLLHNFLFLFLF